MPKKFLSALVFCLISGISSSFAEVQRTQVILDKTGVDLVQLLMRHSDKFNEFSKKASKIRKVTITKAVILDKNKRSKTIMKYEIEGERPAVASDPEGSHPGVVMQVGEARTPRLSQTSSSDDDIVTIVSEVVNVYYDISIFGETR